VSSRSGLGTPQAVSAAEIFLTRILWRVEPLGAGRASNRVRASWSARAMSLALPSMSSRKGASAAPARILSSFDGVSWTKSWIQNRSSRGPEKRSRYLPKEPLEQRHLERSRGRASPQRQAFAVAINQKSAGHDEKSCPLKRRSSFWSSTLRNISRTSLDSSGNSSRTMRPPWARLKRPGRERPRRLYPRNSETWVRAWGFRKGTRGAAS